MTASVDIEYAVNLVETKETLNKFNSFKGLTDQPLERFLEFKGLGDVKIIRIAATFEIALRCVNIVLNDLKEGSNTPRPSDTPLKRGNEDYPPLEKGD